MFTNSFFVLACVQVIFVSISDSSVRRLGLQNRCFRIEGIAKFDLSWKSFLKNFGIDFDCFVDSLGAAFLIFEALKASLKTKRLLVKSQILRSGSGEADLAETLAL